MPAPLFEATFSDFSALLTKLDTIARASFVRELRKVMKQAAKQANQYVVQNLSGAKVRQVTGKTRRAFANAKVRVISRRAVIKVGYEPPTREELEIPPDDPNYYPYALEFGHDGVPPYPFIRPALDEHRGELAALILTEMERILKQELRRLGR